MIPAFMSKFVPAEMGADITYYFVSRGANTFG